MDVAEIPISHHLRRDKFEPEDRFALVLVCCTSCGLPQLNNPVSDELIYSSADSYLTGFQRPRHLQDLVITAIARQDPGRVVDVGCNDGALLGLLREHGYGGLIGIEPNAVAAAVARSSGHMVYVDFFDRLAAARITSEQGRFDTAFVRHVAEHVVDLKDFFLALRELIVEDGQLILELPHIEPGFGSGNPAILWEEHVNYFTEPLAEHLLHRFGFDVLDRRTYAFGGGSIAFVCRRRSEPLAALAEPTAGAAIGLSQGFASRFGVYRDELRAIVSSAKIEGYKLAVYGAAPRSCTVIGSCEIGDAVDVVIDDREAIQGFLMPGTECPILPLKEAVSSFGPRLLCLLGVGAENEYVVRNRLVEAHSGASIFISLLPPRDSLASIANAHEAIAVNQR